MGRGERRKWVLLLGYSAKVCIESDPNTLAGNLSVISQSLSRLPSVNHHKCHDTSRDLSSPRDCLEESQACLSSCSFFLTTVLNTVVAMSWRENEVPSVLASFQYRRSSTSQCARMRREQTYGICLGGGSAGGRSVPCSSCLLKSAWISVQSGRISCNFTFIFFLSGLWEP